MALSNIFREPRRESTEQAFGAAAVSIPIGFVWWASGQVPAGFYEVGAIGYVQRGLIMFAITLAGVLGLFAVVGLSLFMHSVGEDICSDTTPANLGSLGSKP